MSSTMHAAWCTAPARSTGTGLPLGRVLPQVWSVACSSLQHLIADHEDEPDHHQSTPTSGRLLRYGNGTHHACLLLQVQRRCIRVVNVMSPSRQEVMAGECASTPCNAAKSTMTLPAGLVILERPGPLS